MLRALYIAVSNNMQNTTASTAKSTASTVVTAQQAQAQVITLASLVATQQTSTASAFTNYSSKLTLLASNSNFVQAHSASNKAMLQQLAQFKNCFAFSAHVSNKFLVITMYYNANKQYAYFVLNCSTQAMQQYASVKLAKQAVLAQVHASTATTSK